MKQRLTLWQESRPLSSTPTRMLCLLKTRFTTATQRSSSRFSWTHTDTNTAVRGRQREGWLVLYFLLGSSTSQRLPVAKAASGQGLHGPAVRPPWPRRPAAELARFLVGRQQRGPSWAAWHRSNIIDRFTPPPPLIEHRYHSLHISDTNLRTSHVQAPLRTASQTSCSVPTEPVPPVYTAPPPLLPHRPPPPPAGRSSPWFWSTYRRRWPPRWRWARWRRSRTALCQGSPRTGWRSARWSPSGSSRPGCACSRCCRRWSGRRWPAAPCPGRTPPQSAGERDGRIGQWVVNTDNWRSTLTKRANRSVTGQSVIMYQHVIGERRTNRSVSGNIHSSGQQSQDMWDST